MMHVYAINVCTDTKQTDRYDKVAVNPYPLIVLGNEEELKKHLLSEHTKTYIKGLFRTKNLYDVGVFRIRCVDKDYYVKEFEWSIPEYCPIDYN